MLDNLDKIDHDSKQIAVIRSDNKHEFATTFYQKQRINQPRDPGSAMDAAMTMTIHCLLLS